MKRVNKRKVAEYYGIPITGRDKPRQKSRKISVSAGKKHKYVSCPLTSDTVPKTKSHKPNQFRSVPFLKITLLMIGVKNVCFWSQMLETFQTQKEKK